MKFKSRFLVSALAVSLSVTSTIVPADCVKAAQNQEQTLPENNETEYIDDGVEQRELPEESGDYVVYMENDKTGEVSLDEEAREIETDSVEVVLETDLTKEQVEQLEQLEEQTEEVYVEENIFLTGASKSSKHSNKKHEAEEEFAEEPEWNMKMIHADKVLENVAGEPVKVAVLDSGVEFISGIPVEKSINLVKQEQDLPYYMNDMTGHGTAVADLIHRICPQAQIYAVKVMDRDNRGRLSDVVEGIYWCIEQDVDIINMSFGTSVESDILKEAIKAASEQGIMIVSSAGNSGEIGVEYPAAFEEVIAVGAVNTSAQKTEESAVGEEVELAAPGEQILTESMLGLETVNSGTSMAAPHVAGAAAVLMQESGCRDAGVIRKVLDKSSNPLGNENAYGYGLVDVENARKVLQDYEVMAVTADIASDEEDVEKTEEVADGLDSMEQVSTPVETFEEVDYVEGRWKTGLHQEFIKMPTAGDATYGRLEVDIFKMGAIFPDVERTLIGRARWHGSMKQNYVSNFIFATRAAKAGGDIVDKGRTKGQNVEAYDDMKKEITTSTLCGIPWSKIMRDWLDINDYDSRSVSTKKRWRQYFLYGMAMHTATDVFAHSSFYKENGQFYQWDKNTTDKETVCQNRWECAKVLAERVLNKCIEQYAGKATDFSMYGKKCWTGFYLGNIFKYSLASTGGEDETHLKEIFKAVNYEVAE